MRHWRIWLYLVVMAAILFSCVMVSMSNSITVPTSPTQLADASVTKAVVEPAAPAVLPIDPPDEEPTQSPTETEVVVVEAEDQCVMCHMDKVQLIDTAAPEEAVIEESEGAG